VPIHYVPGVYPAQQPAKSSPSSPTSPTGPSFALSPSIGALIVANVLVFVAAVYLRSDLALAFALPAVKIHWLQYVSSAFVHAQVQQLSRNMFLLFVFGEVLRKEISGRYMHLGSAVQALRHAIQL
jgi:membrane associated rhomboid family serine protease